MSDIAVVGAQWGDEGKGKIVDWLSSGMDVIVRFQGGHNAGHTLVVHGETYKLSLLPSGVLRPRAMSAIGSGVVIDPWALVTEITALQERGVDISPTNLRIAETAPLILPIHRDLDELREQRAGTQKIGTTGRGIGPAYEDKVGRRALRMVDLVNPSRLDVGLDRLLAHHIPLREGLGTTPVDREKLRASLCELAPKLADYIGPVWKEIAAWQAEGKRILYEGAQGVMLDIDYGTYPFVTSSNTVAGQAAVGAGVGPGRLQRVLGIAKAYLTRVGAGPFPTELNGDIGQHLCVKGHEKGTVTGRTRRCGWLDAVQLRQAVQISGIGGLALTKIDVLDELAEIKICTGYKMGDRVIDHVPIFAGSEAADEIEPIYQTHPGWLQLTAGARRWEDLPAKAQAYVQSIERLVGCPVKLISTSPAREDTIRCGEPSVAGGADAWALGSEQQPKLSAVA